jgi:hypothetical protein
VASEVASASPDEAVPVVSETLEAIPESPPAPEEPDPADPAADAWPEPPLGALPEVLVLPVAARDVWDALPVGPEWPPLPVVAVLVDTGLATAEPEVPPVAEEVVVEAPDAPEVALPTEDDVAAPEEPPVALPTAAPELPVVTITATAPVPPPAPPPPPPEKTVPEDAPPVVPLTGVAVPAPPAPLPAVTTGLTVAAPVDPVVPPVAVAVAAALPLWADPVVVEPLVDGPEAPPAPVPPVVDAPVPVACPVPPLGPAATGAVVEAVETPGSRLRVAASARTPSSPDMGGDGT